MEKTRIAVLVSGGGTNLQALIDAQKSGVLRDGEIVAVIASRSDAYALVRAAENGIPGTICSRRELGSQEAFEAAIRKELDRSGAELIVLAGFMSILSASFTSAYPRRIINVHPALIPSFCGKGMYGLRPHEAALSRGVRVTGATVHFVNEIPDGGEIIAQKAVEILDGDTPEVLQRRVMEQAEWIILPQSVQKISAEIRTQKEKSMNVYSVSPIGELLSGNTYPGRGIVVGKSENGRFAAAAYFIMGRSANSRNRVFVDEPGTGSVIIHPFDASKVEDPSLIIYYPVRKLGSELIVTNGDQTDTVYDFRKEGKSFEEALETRCFEPDGPNWTPRISAILSFGDGDFSYKMSILKSADPEGGACNRFTYSYSSVAGLGHFLHTYMCDGSPIPTFTGEPERVFVPDGIDEFTQTIWNTLNEANRISLYVRYIDLQTGAETSRMINKNH